MHLCSFILASTLVLCGLQSVNTVDRSKFKTCEQSAFCRRSRATVPNQSPYQLDLSTLTASPTFVEAVLVNTVNDVRFRVEIIGLEDAKFRMRIKEAFPMVPRFEVPHVLVGEPEQKAITVKDQSEEGFTVESHDGSNKAVVRAKPFQVDFYSRGVLVVSSNAKGLIKFEHTRKKPEAGEAVPVDGAEIPEGGAAPVQEDENGMWEESFSCLLYTSPSPRDRQKSRMPSSA